MDTDYYSQLSLDQSSPFFNKATQQTTAPGSTFKILSTIAGMSEGVVVIVLISIVQAPLTWLLLRSTAGTSRDMGKLKSGKQLSSHVTITLIW